MNKSLQVKRWHEAKLHIAGGIQRQKHDKELCPVCAEIKAAEDKRGKEVLELAEHFIGAMSGPKAWKRFREIYQERFHD